jgi:hypothetical protein
MGETSTKSKEFTRGAVAAAAIADDYNKSSLHDHCLGDCILGKMNIRHGRPRANRYKQASEHEGWIAGFAVALAEMHRIDSTSAGVCAAARGAGITIKRLRAVGVSGFDLKELKKAGVK